ncbi:TPA: hypothetical protein QDA97_005210 [Burkholderia vietnamiensis]|nr:hypothetical protein [Burkholderia vietnamiensis]
MLAHRFVEHGEARAFALVQQIAFFKLDRICDALVENRPNFGLIAEMLANLFERALPVLVTRLRRRWLAGHIEHRVRGLHRAEDAVDNACFLALDAGHVEQFEALPVRIEFVAVCVERVVGATRADNLAVRERREVVEQRMRLRLLSFERLMGRLRAVALRIEQRALSRVRRRKFPLPLLSTREFELLR